MNEAFAKGAGDENFPVGSLLIARRLRPAVMAYYAVARAADDVADDPVLAPDAKLRRLDRFDAALHGRVDTPDVAVAVRARLALTAAGVPVDRAARLLVAFRQDAVVARYGSWADLMAYCTDSAVPVGRFLLDLHGEPPSGYPASDALCAALQVINHLQDCGDDFRRLDRVYLPQAWLMAESVPVADLAGTATGPGLRRVLDRCLAGVDALLAEAGPLPLRLHSTRLALETAAILCFARILSDRLKRRDPLAVRVRLTRTEMLWQAGIAVISCLIRRSIGHAGRGRRQPA